MVFSSMAGVLEVIFWGINMANRQKCIKIQTWTKIPFMHLLLFTGLPHEIQ